MVVTRTHVFVDGDTLTAAQLNAEFNNLLNAPGIVNADISAGAAIAVSKIATGLSGSLVGTTDVQTLSFKTLTKPTINGSLQGLTADSDAGTITFDLSASNIHSVTLGGNRTLALSNVSVGQCFLLRIIQGSGSNTVSWFSTVHWINGAAPTLSTAAGHWDTLGFVCTASGQFDGYIVGQNLS